jgi:hypothetical protein
VKLETYTVLAEYRGGTYIKQLTAPGPEAVFASWIASLSEDDLEVSALHRDELIASIDIVTSVPIEGCSGIWCFSTNVAGKLLLAHFVRTAI